MIVRYGTFTVITSYADIGKSAGKLKYYEYTIGISLYSYTVIQTLYHTIISRHRRDVLTQVSYLAACSLYLVSRSSKLKAGIS